MDYSHGNFRSPRPWVPANSLKGSTYLRFSDGRWQPQQSSPCTFSKLVFRSGLPISGCQLEQTEMCFHLSERSKGFWLLEMEDFSNTKSVHFGAVPHQRKNIHHGPLLAGKQCCVAGDVEHHHVRWTAQTAETGDDLALKFWFWEVTTYQSPWPR